MIEIEIGLHTESMKKVKHIDEVSRKSGTQVTLLQEKDRAIRETLAEELTPVAGKVCVTEGKFITVHNVGEELIEIPLHVYGNGTKTNESLEKIIREDAVINGTELYLQHKHWPSGFVVNYSIHTEHI